MGGYIAFEFLRRWRDRVRGLVLVDTRAEADTPEGKKGRDTAAATAREQGAEAIADSMLPQVLGASTLAGAPATVERVRAMMAATPVAGIVGALGAMRDRPDSTAMLPELGGHPDPGDRGGRRRGDPTGPGSQPWPTPSPGPAWS